MCQRLRPFWQYPELRFYLTLVFMVWSLVPHYRLLVHAHGGSGNGHEHATLSVQEMELADKALQSLPSADPKEFGGESSVTFPAAAHGSFWTPGAGLFAHAHFQQDLNSVEVLVLLPASTGPPAAESSQDLLYRAPAAAVPAHRPARGPPASFLA